MPGADLTQQLLEPLQRLVTHIEAGGEPEELHEVEVHVVQTHHVEGPELGVELVHLAVPEEGGELGGPEEGGREHGGGEEGGEQHQVTGHQQSLVTLWQPAVVLRSRMSWVKFNI